MVDKRQSKQKLHRLEALRGLAAFYVLLHHTIPHVFVVGGFNFGVLLRFGQEAVILFFLLSGFVINYSYRLGSNKSFRHYFTARFLRIYIPLFFVFIISYLSFSYNAGALVNVDLKTLLGNIFMLQDWGFSRPNVIVEAYMDNGPLWSLSYEWWFYMLYFPLANMGLSVANRDRLVFLIAIACACLYLFYPHYFVRVGMYLAIWWAGVRLADAYIDQKLVFIRTHIPTILTLSTIVAVLFLNVLLLRSQGVSLTLGRYPIIEFRHVLFATVAFIASLIIHRIGWRWFDVATRPFLLIAPVSYALYVVHVPLARHGEYLEFISNPYVEWAGYIAVTFLVAYLIELVLYPRIRAWLLRRASAAAIADSKVGHPQERG